MELVYNVNQLFPKAQYVALECLILSTTQRYEFTLNMHIEEAGSLFSPEKNHQTDHSIIEIALQLINYLLQLYWTAIWNQALQF